MIPHGNPGTISMSGGAISTDRYDDGEWHHIVGIFDKISDSSYKVFKNNNISVDKKFNLSENEIVSIISKYDGVVVRSSTKITKKIIKCVQKFQKACRS